MQTRIETTWIVSDTDADKRDVVMIALNRGYNEDDLQKSFIEAMRKHMSECRARYVTAFNMDLWLSQETAFGMRWGKR